METHEHEAEEEAEVMVVVALVGEDDHTTIKMEVVDRLVTNTRARSNAIIVRRMVTMQQNARIEDVRETLKII